MKVPVLTYHSMKIHGSAYAENDLVALASDLETIHAHGFRMVPLAHVVAEWRRGGGALTGNGSSRSPAMTGRISIMLTFRIRQPGHRRVCSTFFGTSIRAIPM